MSIVEGFNQLEKEKVPQAIQEEQNEKSGAWDYFDGTHQGDSPFNGIGGVLFLSEDHVSKYKVGLNLVELMHSELLISLATEKKVLEIQFFGDYLIVVTV